MLVYDNKRHALAQFAVHYTDGEDSGTHYANNLDYYKAFEERWDSFTIDKIEELTYTDEQVARLEEVAHMPEGYTEVYESYVIDGVIDTEDMPDNHPFVTFALKKENEELSNKTAMLGASLTQERLNNVKKSFEITQLRATVERLEADVSALKGGDE